MPVKKEQPCEPDALSERVYLPADKYLSKFLIH